MNSNEIPRKMPAQLKLTNSHKFSDSEKAMIRFINRETDTRGFMKELDKCYLSEKRHKK